MDENLVNDSEISAFVVFISVVFLSSIIWYKNSLRKVVLLTFIWQSKRTWWFCEKCRQVGSWNYFVGWSRECGVAVSEDIRALGRARDGRGRLRRSNTDPDAARVHPRARGGTGRASRAEARQAAPVCAAAAPRERGSTGQHVDPQQRVNDHRRACVSRVAARGRTAAQGARPVPACHRGETSLVFSLSISQTYFRWSR